MNSELALDFLSKGSIYLLFILGGLFAFLAFAPIFGFIPYSAQPGWQTEAFMFSKDDIYENALFMASWIRILAVYAIFVFIILFSIIRVMESYTADKTNIVYTSGILSAFLSGLITHYAGWHILIDTSVVILSFVLGLVFGLWILPKERLRYSMMKK